MHCLAPIVGSLALMIGSRKQGVPVEDWREKERERGIYFASYSFSQFGSGSDRVIFFCHSVLQALGYNNSALLLIPSHYPFLAASILPILSR